MLKKKKNTQCYIKVVQYSDSSTPYSPRAHHDKGTHSIIPITCFTPPTTHLLSGNHLFSAVKSLFLGLSPLFSLPLLIRCFLSATRVKSYGVCPSLTLLNILLSGSIQVIANGKISLFYGWVIFQCVCVCVWIYIFTHVHTYRTSSSFTHLSKDAWDGYWK